MTAPQVTVATGWIQRAANAAGAALLWWWAAPLVPLGGSHPFEPVGPRLVGLAILAAAAALFWAARQWRRRRRDAALVSGLRSGSPGSALLAERFDQATSLLRSGLVTGGQRHWRWGRRRHLYQLPWYVFIGAPGAGKTTALLHAGLRFPLAERLGSAPVAGVGGTRQCDWWFTDEAVFIDTAGRFTTQDSHGATDAQEWRTFLRLLARHRSDQPINGVVVTVSVPDLLHGGDELARQAAAVDDRLQELRAELGLSFPVYLLVTKADLLAGFVDFFGSLDTAEREAPWGLCFDLPAAGDPALPVDLEARLATLGARLTAATAARVERENQRPRRAAIYTFASQFDTIRPALHDFARRAFRHVADAPRQWVRGIHFSSGTQEGTPIDRVLGELSRQYGMSLPAEAPQVADRGKAYFLARLLKDLVIAEAPLAGRSLRRRALRRRRNAALGSVVALALVTACAGWLLSYRRNADYVAAVGARVHKVSGQLDPAAAARIDRLLPLYGLLGELAHSGLIDPDHAPWGFDFGLFQGPRLARSAEQAYHRALDRTLAPLLAERLGQEMQRADDPVARYEALRVGLMLTTGRPASRDEVRRWAARALSSERVAGEAGAATPRSSPDTGPGAGEQPEWLAHLDALLERNAVQAVVRLDPRQVEVARAALRQQPLIDRVDARLLRRAAAQAPGEKGLAALTSDATLRTFAPPGDEALPGLPATLERATWHGLVAPQVEPTIAELAGEATWVLDDKSAATAALVRDPAARASLAREIGERDARAAIAAWQALLGALRLDVPGDAVAMAQLSQALAAAGSPWRLLLARVAAEFAPPAAGGMPAPAAAAFDETLQGAFGPLHAYAAGTGALAVDRLVAPLATVLRDPGAAGAGPLLGELKAEAARAPAPFAGFWTAWADALAIQQQRAVRRQLGSGLADVAKGCQRLTNDRFPFSASAARDMPLADFARVFGPNGLLDGFFRTRLAGRIDTRQRPWRWTDTAAAPPAATLRAFEMADDIRRLFFPPGAELPQLRLQVTPSSMDAELLLFSADIDGQLIRYENGPRRPKPVVWPGPATGERVLLRTLPPGPSGVGAVVQEGPWALLRVLQRGGWETGAAGATTFGARLVVDGRALTVELRSDAPVSAALLARLASFRCPEPW